MGAILRTIFLAACVLATLGCDRPESSGVAPSKPAPSDQDAATDELLLIQLAPADYPHLHNVIKISDTIYSGGEPEGEEAFADLAKLGVKVVVSVDGTRPNIAAAHKHGLRYVHIPIGYDGIPEQAGLALARVVREGAKSGEPVYFHCHHGKHRGPSAAATACIAAGVAENSSALEILEKAGTGKEYAGLWRDVTAYQSPPVDATLPELVEVAEVDSMVTAMSQIDHAFDNLKLCQTAKWATPADHPDIVAAQEALLVKEALHETGRNLAEGYDEQFVQWLGEVEGLAVKLEQQLKAGDTTAATQTMVGLDQACKRCHVTYRN